MRLNTNTFKTLFLCLALSGPLLAQAAPWKEGTHFLRLETPIETLSGANIEVVEAFSYGCPACYAMEKPLAAWRQKLPSSVTFRKAPISFNKKTWQQYARLYFTVKALNLPDSAHEKVFDAILTQRKAMDMENMASLFTANNIQPEQFHKTFRSFGVKRKLHRSDTRLSGAAIQAIPSLIINGKYVLSPSTAGSQKALFEIADYLIKKESRHTEVALHSP